VESFITLSTEMTKLCYF